MVSVHVSLLPNWPLQITPSSVSKILLIDHTHPLGMGMRLLTQYHQSQKTSASFTRSSSLVFIRAMMSKIQPSKTGEYPENIYYRPLKKVSRNPLINITGSLTNTELGDFLKLIILFVTLLVLC